MPQFQNKEEYEKWKAERVRATAAKSQEETIVPPEPTEILNEAKPQAVTSSIKKKTEFAGVGCLIQFAGIIFFLISFTAFPVGPIFGFLIMIILFIIGSQKAAKYYCVNCGNPIDNKNVKLCPSCKVNF